MTLFGAIRLLQSHILSSIKIHHFHAKKNIYEGNEGKNHFSFPFFLANSVYPEVSSLVEDDATVFTFSPPEAEDDVQGMDMRHLEICPAQITFEF